MNNAPTGQVREVNIAIVKRLNERYDVDIDLFDVNETGNNRKVGGTTTT